MSDSQNNINAFASDKCKIQFSNIPTVDTVTKDLSFLYENFVKSVTVPDYNLEMVQSNFRDGVINHPISKNNDNLSDLLVEFTLDEKALNYSNLLKYVRELRYGNINRPPPSETRNSNRRRESYIRLYDIKSINIILLDNQKIARQILQFKECFIHSISTLSLQFGTSDKVTFTVNFKYQEFDPIEPE